ncbi:MAG: sigma-70 family RNA polymerase sigma factor [Planctomycetota bacterium]
MSLNPSTLASTDPAALTGAAVVPLSGGAYQVAVRVLGRVQDAEDVVQRAYLKVMSGRRPVLSEAEVRPWFLGVVVNTAREHLRSEARRRHWEDRAMAESRQMERGEPAGAEGTVSPEIKVALRAEIAALAERERLPLVLCYEQGLTQAEAAQALGISPRVVSKAVTKGLHELRQALTRRGLSAAPAVVISGLKFTAPLAPSALGGTVQQLMISAAANAAVGSMTGAAAAAGGSATTGGAAGGATGAAGSSVAAVKLAALAAVLLALAGTWVFDHRQSRPRTAVAIGPMVSAPVNGGPGAGSVPVAPPAPPTSATQAQPNAAHVQVWVDSWMANQLFSALRRHGIVVAVMGQVENFHLRVPWGLRGQTVSAQALVAAVAKSANMQVQWDAANRFAILYRGAAADQIKQVTADLRSPDVKVRLAAATRAAELEDPSIFAPLLPAALDADPQVALTAQASLRYLGADAMAITTGKDCLPALKAIDAAFRNGVFSEPVELSAAQILGDAALPAVLKYAEDPANVWYIASMTALGTIPGPQAEKALQTLFQHAQPSQRWEFIGAWFCHGGATGRKALAELAGDNGQWSWQVCCYGAELGDTTAGRKCLQRLMQSAPDSPGIPDIWTWVEQREDLQNDGEDLSQAVAALMKGDARQRCLAGKLLAHMPCAAALDRLLKLAADSDPGVQTAAVEGLTISPDPRADAALCKLATDLPKDYRGVPIMALALHDTPAAVAALQDAAASPSPGIRRSVAVNLCFLANPARDALRKNLMSDADSDVRIAAVPSGFDMPLDRAALVSALHNSDPKIRSIAVANMESASLAEAAPVIEAAMKDPDIQVRIAAGQVARHFCVARTTACLRTLVNDPNFVMRESVVIDDLRDLPDAWSLPIWKTIAADPNAEVRQLNVSNNLCSGRSAGRQEALLLYAQDPDAYTRQLAYGGLQWYSGEQVLAALTKGLSDAVPANRQAAAQSLGAQKNTAARDAILARMKIERDLQTFRSFRQVIDTRWPKDPVATAALAKLQEPGANEDNF